MKRKVLSLALVCCMLLTMLPQVALGVVIDIPITGGEGNLNNIVASGASGSLTWSLNKEGMLRISGSGAMPDYGDYEAPWMNKDVDIVSVVIEAGVTKIGAKAFAYCFHLESVSVPDSITKIGDQAFFRCRKLQSVTIPAAVESIGNMPFTECDELDGIWVDADNQHYCNDDNGVLYTKDRKTLIQAPGKLIGDYSIAAETVKISECAFYACYKLTGVTIPSNVAEIGASAFGDCQRVKAYTVAEDSQFFSNDEKGVLLSKDKTVLIQVPCTLNGWYEAPAEVVHVSDYAFMYCSSLSYIKFSGAVKTIGDYAFFACSGLRGVILLDGITDIGEGAFYACISLQDITLPKTVSSIQSYTFFDCAKLIYITIAKSVTQIGEYAFSGCTTLNHVLYSGSKWQWNDIVIDSMGNDTIAAACRHDDVSTIVITSLGDPPMGTEGPMLHCSVCGKQIYPDLPISGTFGKNLTWTLDPDGTLTISGSGAMETYETPWSDSKIAVTNVVIAEGITYIAPFAFSGCTTLQTVTIADSVTGIGMSAFSGCTSLTDITMGQSVVSIEFDAFGNCDSLNFNIYDNAFYLGNVTNPYLCLIRSVNEDVSSCVIHENTKVIAAYAFYRCKNLTEIAIPDSVVSMGEYAFYECTALGKVTLSENMTDIAGYTFWNCGNLYSVTMGSQLTSIGESAFYSCENLSDVIFPDTLISIDNTAFCECAMTTVVIPDSVVTIGDMAFMDCSNLTNLTIGNGVQSIGGGAFGGCVGLKYNSYEDVNYLGNENNPYMVLVDCQLQAIVSHTVHQDTKIVLGDAFNSCENLESLILPNGLISMGRILKKQDSSLQYHIYENGRYLGSEANPYMVLVDAEYVESIKVHDDTRIIAEGVLSYHVELTNITISASVEHIGQSAFWQCCSLTDIYYGGTQTQWDNVYIGPDNECLEGVMVHCSEEEPVQDGWVLEDGNWVYYENGAKVCNTWKLDSVGWCYLTADGTMATNQWIMDSQGWCYVDGSGYCVTNCWMQDSQGWCYLNSEGRMAVNTWILDSVGWCYVGADGYCVTNCWMQDSVGWVYLDAEGRMVTNSWIMDSVGWCYLGEDGYAVTNCWKQDSVGWCYLDSNGSMTKNRWVETDGNWYYLDANGYRVTNTEMSGGWIDANGIWTGYN